MQRLLHGVGGLHRRRPVAIEVDDANRDLRPLQVLQQRAIAFVAARNPATGRQRCRSCASTACLTASAVSHRRTGWPRTSRPHPLSRSSVFTSRSQPRLAWAQPWLLSSWADCDRRSAAAGTAPPWPASPAPADSRLVQRVDDLRGHDHHQLHGRAIQILGAKQLPQHRDIGDTRHLAQTVGGAVVENAGDAEALPVFELHFGLRPAGRQCRQAHSRQ